MTKTFTAYDRISHAFGEALYYISLALCFCSVVCFLSLSGSSVYSLLDKAGVNMTTLLFSAGFAAVAFAALAIVTRIPAWYNRAEANTISEEVFEGKND